MHCSVLPAAWQLPGELMADAQSCPLCNLCDATDNWRVLGRVCHLLMLRPRCFSGPCISGSRPHPIATPVASCAAQIAQW
jgi:hypothetical protein